MDYLVFKNKQATNINIPVSSMEYKRLAINARQVASNCKTVETQKSTQTALDQYLQRILLMNRHAERQIFKNSSDQIDIITSDMRKIQYPEFTKKIMYLR